MGKPAAGDFVPVAAASSRRGKCRCGSHDCRSWLSVFSGDWKPPLRNEIMEDSLPDRALVMEGLLRLAGSLEGLPLLAKKGLGAFPATGAGREAAALCERDGLVRTLREETVGKNKQAYFTLSASGRDWLLNQYGPRPVLEELTRVLDARLDEAEDRKRRLAAQEDQITHLASFVKAALQALKQQPSPGIDLPLPGEVDILAALQSWRIRQPLEDTPLPELFQLVLRSIPDLTIGQFHDACRSLVHRRRMYVHPWTGPLFEMPEPSLALMIGHEVGYYASLRQAGRTDDTPSQPTNLLQQAM